MIFVSHRQWVCEVGTGFFMLNLIFQTVLFIAESLREILGFVPIFELSEP